MRIFRALLLTAALAVSGLGCAPDLAGRDVLFQTSTLYALMEGVYDGDVTCGELKSYGDVGLGTFNALDGEMVVLDGEVYQVKADGRAYRSDDSARTPFAAVTFFEPDTTASLQMPLTLGQLTAHVDSMLSTANVPYAVRIHGAFQYVKTRSVPRQHRPYPRLAEVVKKQPIFEFHAVRGTVVGFRLPAYVAGLNVAGYHLHFLTADRTGGGHVLELVTTDVKIEIDSCSALHVALPETAGFAQADLTRRSAGELRDVEK